MARSAFVTGSNELALLFSTVTGRRKCACAMPPAVCANSSAKSSSSRISLSAMSSMREGRGRYARGGVLLVDTTHHEHDQRRDQCGYRGRVEQLFRAPLPTNQHAADVRTDDRADAADAEPCAYARRAQIGRIVARRKRVQAR